MSGALDSGVLLAPLLAGLLVAASHVVLGRRVLDRGIVFIDLAIAQVAVLGALALDQLGGPEDGWAVTAASGAAALAAAALLAWTERTLPQVQEALIGALYVVAASAAILLVAHDPHGAEHFEDLLSGQLLWVTAADLVPLAAVTVPVLALWWGWASARPLAFYFVFAVAVMASVRVVGVFLVFATLIIPALAVQGWRGPGATLVAFLLGATGYALGLWLSVPMDLPAGPLVVCMLAVLALGLGVLRRFAGGR